MVLPAVLNIVGPRTWRIPAWLDRILPHINIEGTSVRPLDDEGVELELDGSGERERAGVL